VIRSRLTWDLGFCQRTQRTSAWWGSAEASESLLTGISQKERLAPCRRAEVDFLDLAGRARASAAAYATPEETVAVLDHPTRTVVTAITRSHDAVHTLQLHPRADKPGALAAIADAAHHDNHRVLALARHTRNPRLRRA
jgi:hypothetical protein